MEIHHADKAYRKRSLWLLAGIILMCGVLLWQLLHQRLSMARDAQLGRYSRGRYPFKHERPAS